MNDAIESSAFDWVAERTACTIPRMYRQLRAEVEADVRLRNENRPADAAYEFRIEETESSFAVALVGADFTRTVTFLYEPHAITVLDSSGNQLFDITLVFTEDGKCRLKAKEENREPWQVRRMALEDLFFRFVE